MRVLITGGAPAWVETKLQLMGCEVVGVAADAYVDEAKFVEGIQGFDVYVSGGLEKCTAAVIEAADKLRAIVFLGVDYKVYIDEAAAAKKGVVIFNTPGANARAVAELTLLLMLMASRKAARMLADMGQHVWKAQTGFELLGKTLGLVGSGFIAQEVSAMAEGLGMKVIYTSRSGLKAEMRGAFVDLETLLAQSEVLSLHVPKEAGVLLDKAAFAKLNKCKVLVNTAPAALVDVDSLYVALEQGTLLSVAFDPFYVEGQGAWNCAEARLFELGAEKFFGTPHAGWRTAEADDKMFEMALTHIAGLVA